ncbi:unnamed protein product, partial [Allacma fusca]
HYSKLKKTSNMKIIPPFRPVPNNPHNHQSADSSSSEMSKGQLQISPDINKVTSLKKKLSGSSATSSSSKGSNSSHISCNSNMPRIAPSNLFSTNSFSSSLTKSGGSTERTEVSHESKEDSFVLKSEDLKGSGSSATNGEAKKFLKTNDFMTVKLNDVLTASLDRPIHEPSPRDKSQPPDIKPHVTLTPIPIRSNDKIQEKSTILFGQQSASISKAKDSAHLGSNPEIENSMAEISPKFSSDTNLSPTKRSGRINVEFESPTSTDSRPQRHDPEVRSTSGSDRGGNTPSNWEGLKQQQSQQAPITRNSSDERHHHLPNNNPDPSDDLSKGPDDPEMMQLQSQIPLKRGPGRPVKRRSGPGREDERLEDHHLRKKCKRGGRRGVSGYSRREEISEPPTLEDNSVYDRKHHSHRKSSNPTPTKPPEEITPTLSQLKAQSEASKLESSSVLPAHMFG